MSVSAEVRSGVAASEERIVLVVINTRQKEALLRECGPLIDDPKVQTNQIMGIPFEVNDAWTGQRPLMLTERQVEEYRGARRRFELRDNPAWRTRL